MNKKDKILCGLGIAWVIVIFLEIITRSPEIEKLEPIMALIVLAWFGVWSISILKNVFKKQNEKSKKSDK